MHVPIFTIKFRHLRYSSDCYVRLHETCSDFAFCILKQACEDSTAEGKVPEEEDNLRRLLRYEDAPEFLQYNPYILRGYRGCLTTKLCLERFDLPIPLTTNNFRFRRKMDVQSICTRVIAP